MVASTSRSATSVLDGCECARQGMLSYFPPQGMLSYLPPQGSSRDTWHVTHGTWRVPPSSRKSRWKSIRRRAALPRSHLIGYLPGDPRDSVEVGTCRPRFGTDQQTPAKDVTRLLCYGSASNTKLLEARPGLSTAASAASAAASAATSAATSGSERIVWSTCMDSTVHGPGAAR